MFFWYEVFVLSPSCDLLQPHLGAFSYRRYKYAGIDFLFFMKTDIVENNR